MSLSSIFSFDTLKAGKLTIRTPLIAVLFVMAVEFGLHFNTWSDHRPDEGHKATSMQKMPSWMAYSLPLKIDRLKSLTDGGRERMDVLFLGDSQVGAGFMPGEFEREFEASTGRRLRAYNAAIPGQNTTVFDLLLKDVFCGLANPRIIVYGISPQMINSASESALAPSKKLGRELMDLKAKGTIEYNLKQKALKYLDALYLYRHRSEINRALYDYMNPVILYGGTNDVIFDDGGYMVQCDGLFTRRSGGVKDRDNRMTNFNPYGSLLKSLDDTASWCRERQIGLMLMVVPATDQFYDHFNRPELDFKLYVRVVQEMSASHNAVFWNPSEERRFNDNEFADQLHLNALGARRLTRMLAKKFSGMELNHEAFFR